MIFVDTVGQVLSLGAGRDEWPFVWCPFSSCFDNVERLTLCIVIIKNTIFVYSKIVKFVIFAQAHPGPITYFGFDIPLAINPFQVSCSV